MDLPTFSTLVSTRLLRFGLPLVLSLSLSPTSLWAASLDRHIAEWVLQLGGSVGLGTLLFAFGIGYAVSIGLYFVAHFSPGIDPGKSNIDP